MSKNCFFEHFFDISHSLVRNLKKLFAIGGEVLEIGPISKNFWNEKDSKSKVGGTKVPLLTSRSEG